MTCWSSKIYYLSFILLNLKSIQLNDLPPIDFNYVIISIWYNLIIVFKNTAIHIFKLRKFYSSRAKDLLLLTVQNAH
jgi:hypothetical protein